jgi:hypothetical protein
MSISGPNANTAVSPAPARRRAAPGTFSLSEGETPRAAGRRRRCGRGGIDALIALQGLENRLGGASRGSSAAVSRSMRSTSSRSPCSAAFCPRSRSGKSKSFAGGLKGGSRDDGLDGVLGEIELRVEVEIAKMAAR